MAWIDSMLQSATRVSFKKTINDARRNFPYNLCIWKSRPKTDRATLPQNSVTNRQTDQFFKLTLVTRLRCDRILWNFMEQNVYLYSILSHAKIDIGFRVSLGARALQTQRKVLKSAAKVPHLPITRLLCTRI